MNKKKEGLFKGASVAELYSKFGVVLILILCLIIGTILSPEFLTGSNLMSVARNVGVYAIIALGMTRLLIGGGVDLSAGSNVAFCSVIVAVIYAQTGSTLMAVIAAILCGMIIGAINGYFASYIGLMPFIVTLATQMTVRGLAYLVAGGVNFEFEAIIGSVLGGTSMAGGIGNVAMSIVGIYVVGIINNVMNLCSVNAFWQQVVKGIVILIAVLLDIFTRNAIMKSTKKR